MNELIKKINDTKKGSGRVIPELSDSISLDKQLMRYKFIVDYVKNKKVLDIGCGCGFGTHFLSNYAKKIIGLDINNNVIKYCKSKYKNKNLKFKKGSAIKLDFKNNFFDTICSFEVIEHIKDYHKFIKESKRVLKNNGVFICSTPNKEVYKEDFPGHIKEFYCDEFFKTLKKYFSSVKIFGIKHKHTYLELVNKLYMKMPRKIRINVKKIIKPLLRIKTKENKNMINDYKSSKYLISDKNVKNSRYFIAVCKK